MGDSDDPAKMAVIYNGIAEEILNSAQFSRRLKEVVELVAQAFIDKLVSMLMVLGDEVVNRKEFADIQTRAVEHMMAAYHDQIERMVNERLFTATAAAEFLGITPEHFSKLDRAGVGPAPMNDKAKGKSRRWSRSSLMAYVRDGGPKPVPKKTRR